MSSEHDMMRMIVDADHTQAARGASKKQVAFEQEAASMGLSVETYFRYTETWPMTEGLEPLSPGELGKRQAQLKLLEWDHKQARAPQPHIPEDSPVSEHPVHASL